MIKIWEAVFLKISAMVTYVWIIDFKDLKGKIKVIRGAFTLVL